jgi:hypothetical protein
MRQTLQVVWLHICKKWKSLGENWAQTELGISIPISDEAGTSAYRDFYFFFFTKKKKPHRLRIGKVYPSKEKSGSRI